MSDRIISFVRGLSLASLFVLLLPGMLAAQHIAFTAFKADGRGMAAYNAGPHSGTTSDCDQPGLYGHDMSSFAGGTCAYYFLAGRPFHADVDPDGVEVLRGRNVSGAIVRLDGFAAALSASGYAASDVSMTIDGVLSLGDDVEGQDWTFQETSNGYVETRYYRTGSGTFTLHLDGAPMLTGPMPRLTIIFEKDGATETISGHSEWVPAGDLQLDATSPVEVREAGQALLDEMAAEGLRFYWDSQQQIIDLDFNQTDKSGSFFDIGLGRIDVSTSGSIEEGGRFTEDTTSTFTGDWEETGARRIDLGDYDNDGHLDLIATATLEPRTRLYRYDAETGTFVRVDAGLVDLARGDAAWGDYDGDGYLDLALFGDGGSIGNVARVYRNVPGPNGTRTFEDVGAQAFEPTRDATVAWGDYDRDGDLDLVHMGGGVTKLYENAGPFVAWVNGRPLAYNATGPHVFRAKESALPALNYGSLAWGDYDADGYPDLAISGGGTFAPELYHNDGASGFSPADPALPVAVNDGSVTWFDHDLDDDLDASNHYLSYRNEDDGTNWTQQMVSFPNAPYSQSSTAGDVTNDGYPDVVIHHWLLENIARDGERTFDVYDILPVSDDPSLPENYFYDAALGDLDRDGDLDLVVGSLLGIHVYYNDTQTLNLPVSAPTGPSAAFDPDAGTATLSWSGPAQQGLTYNVYVSHEAGIEVMAGQADEGTGRSRVAALGNAGTAQSIVLRDLRAGEHCWGVQAVDASFDASGFVNGGCFRVPAPLNYEVVLEDPLPMEEYLWRKAHPISVVAGSKERPMEDLFGASLRVVFDPEVLTATHVETGGLLAVESDILPPTGTTGMSSTGDTSDTVAFAYIDNTEGYVAFSLSRTRGSQPVDGYGVLADVYFTLREGAEPQATALSLAEVELVDDSGESIGVDVAPLKVYPGLVPVWPGDLDADSSITAADVFEIGDFFGMTGPERPALWQDWQLTYAQPWDTLAGTFADGNGDGVVSEKDLLVVGRHFGRIIGGTTATSPTARLDGTVERASVEVPALEAGETFYLVAAVEEAPVAALRGAAVHMNVPSQYFRVRSTQPGAALAGEQVLNFGMLDSERDVLAAAITRPRQAVAATAIGDVVAVELEVVRDMGQPVTVTLLDHYLNGPDGQTSTGGRLALSFSPHYSTAVDEAGAVLGQFALGDAYPNPLRHQGASVSYTLPQAAHVALRLYDALGREVETLVEERRPAGTYHVRFDGRGLSSGIYFVRMEASGFSATKKVVVLR